MVNDLSELNEMNRLLITRYQEYEDREAEVDDEENSRSCREQRRYMDQTERLEQQLEDLRLAYEVASTELQRLQRQQGEVAQCEGVIVKLTDQVDKMRGDCLNQRSKIEELHGQSTALRNTRVTDHLGGPGLEARRVTSDVGKSQ